MNASTQTEAVTRRFARVIGPFLFILTGTAVVRAPQLWAHVSEFAADAMWTWVAGAFVLLAGLVVVALHPYWRGVAAFSVSALGWVAVVKGVALLTVPATVASIPAATMGAIGWWRVLFVLFALLGLYLTYVGFAPAPRRSAPRAVGPGADLPHAA